MELGLSWESKAGSSLQDGNRRIPDAHHIDARTKCHQSFLLELLL